MSGLSDTVHKSLELAKTELRARFVDPVIKAGILWGLIVLFGLGGLVFLYVLADRFLADRLDDPVAAAAILLAVNVGIMLLMLAFRAASARRR